MVDVSVILSIHKNNQITYQSIDSIINQNCNNFELILIIDNPDKDFKKSIEKKYSSLINNKKIILKQNNFNMGLTKSLNIAIKLSRGKYLMRQDSDDISLPNRINILLNYFKKNPSKKLLFSNAYKINENNKKIGSLNPKFNKKNIFGKLKFKNIIPHPTVIIDKETMQNIGTYNELFKVSQDFELWHRICLNDPNLIGFVPEKLILLRYGNERISKNNDYLQRVNSLIIISRSRFKYLRKNIDACESTDEMYHLLLTKKNSNVILRSFVFAYIYEIKTPAYFFLNIFFLMNIILIFINNHQLLIKNLIHKFLGK